MTIAGLIAANSEAVWKWAAQVWSPFSILQHLNPFVTAIFFSIYAFFNLISLVGEVMAKRKEEPTPSESEIGRG